MHIIVVSTNVGWICDKMFNKYKTVVVFNGGTFPQSLYYQGLKDDVYYLYCFNNASDNKELYVDFSNEIFGLLVNNYNNVLVECSSEMFGLIDYLKEKSKKCILDKLI